MPQARSSLISKSFFEIRNDKKLWDSFTPDEQEEFTRQAKELAQKDQRSESVAGGFTVEPETGKLSSTPSDIQRQLEIEKAGLIRDPNKPGYTGALMQGLRTGTGNVMAIAPEVLAPIAEMVSPDTAWDLQQAGKTIREKVGGEADPNIPQELGSTKLGTSIVAGDWDKALSRESLGDLYNYGMGQLGNMAPSAALSMGTGALAAKIAPRVLAPLVAEGTAGRQVLEKAKAFTGASGKVLAGAAGSTLGAGVPMEISAVVSDATEAGKHVDPLSTLAAGTAAGLVEAPMNIMLGKRLGNILAPEGKEIVDRGITDATMSFLKDAPKTALFEGAQEGAQRVFERMGGVGNKVYDQVIDPTDILENVAGGAVGGMGMSGVTTLGRGIARSVGRRLGLTEDPSAPPTPLINITPTDWATAKKQEIMGKTKGAKTQAQAQEIFDSSVAQAQQEAASDPDHFGALVDLLEKSQAELDNAKDSLPEFDHSIKTDRTESEKAMEMYADPDLEDLGGTVRAHLEGLMTPTDLQKSKEALANTIKQRELAANIQQDALSRGESSQFEQEQMAQAQPGRQMPKEDTLNVMPGNLQASMFQQGQPPTLPPAPQITPEEQHILGKAARNEPLAPFEQEIVARHMNQFPPQLLPGLPAPIPPDASQPGQPPIAPQPIPPAPPAAPPVTPEAPSAPPAPPKFSSQYDVEEQRMREKGLAPERIEVMKKAGFMPKTDIGINDASQIGHHNTELARMEQFAEENQTNGATAKISLSNLKGVNSALGEDGGNRVMGEMSRIIRDRLGEYVRNINPEAFVNVWRTGGPNFAINAVGDGITGDVLSSIVARISSEINEMNNREVPTKEGKTIKLGEIKHPTLDIRGMKATFGVSDLFEVSPTTGKKMNLRDRYGLLEDRIKAQEAAKDDTAEQWKAGSPNDTGAVSSIKAMAEQPDARAGVHQRGTGAGYDEGGRGPVRGIVPSGLAEGLGTASGAVGRAYEAEGLTREEIELMGPGHAGAGVIQLDPSFGLVDGRNGWSTRILFNHLRSLAEENKRDYSFVMIDHKAVSSINALMDGNTEYANALIRLVMSRINSRLLRESATQDDVTGVRVGGDETGAFVKMSPSVANRIMDAASEEIHAALKEMGLDKVPNFKYRNNRAMWGAGFYFHVVPITPTSTYQQVMDEAGKMIEVAKDTAKSRAQQALIDMQKAAAEKAKYPLGPPRKTDKAHIYPTRGPNGEILYMAQPLDQYGNAFGDPVAPEPKAEQPVKKATPKAKTEVKPEPEQKPLGDIIIKSAQTGETVEKIPVQENKPAAEMSTQERAESIADRAAKRMQAKQEQKAQEQKSKTDLVKDIFSDVDQFLKLNKKGAIDLKTSQPIMTRIFKNVIELGYRTFKDAVKFLKSLIAQNENMAKFLADDEVQEFAETMWDIYAEEDTNISPRDGATIKELMKEEQQNEPQGNASPERNEPVGAAGAVADGRGSDQLAQPARSAADEGADAGEQAAGNRTDNLQPARPDDAAANEPGPKLDRGNEDSQRGMAIQPSGDLRGSNGVSGEVPNTPVDDNRLEYAHAPGESMLEKKIGPTQRFEANIKAIALLKKLTEENRLATADEQKILAEFSGWGPIPQAFFREHFTSSYFNGVRYGNSPANAFSRAWNSFGYEYNGATDKQWLERRKQLLFSMDAAQYNAARASTINAHYTSPALYRAIWDGLRHLGFSGGNVLEPAIGSGIAISNMPAELRSASGITGVDMDATSAGISKHLFQKSMILHSPFQEAQLPDNFFNLIISNVPFADIAISHKGKPYNRFLLHDYFFARSLDLVRPGGMVAFITSKGTLDKIDPKVREYLSNDYRDSDGVVRPGFDLLTAIRYPRNAFKDIANTEVVTDLLVLRKRPETGMKAQQIPSELVDVETKQGPIKVNKFFQENPGNLLGTLDKKGTMYGSDSPSMAPIDGMDLSAKTAEIIKQIKPIQQEAQSVEKIQEVSKSMPGVFYLKDGKILVNKGGIDVTADLSEAGKKIVTAFIPLRDSATKVIGLMTDSNSSEKDISAAQAEMKKEYDKFVQKHGRVYEQGVRRVIESDPLSGRVFALEKVEIVSTGSKTLRGKTVDIYSPKFVGLADIFTKRTIRAIPEVVRVDTIEDASIASLANKGRLDLDYMGKLLGKDPEQLRSEALASGAFFENPNGLALETRDQYLSGEVKIKLTQAQAAAKLDPRYQKNVEELTKVIPADIPSNLISMDIGAPWIPAQIFKDFFSKLMGMSRSSSSKFSLAYSKSGGGWVVSTSGVTANDGAKWGVSGTNYEWSDLVSDTMTLKTPNIKIGYKDNNGVFIKDEKASAEATSVAIQKQNQLRVAFQQWLAENEESTKELATIFNQTYNGYVLRDYDGSALQFPGADMSVFKGGDFRKNQKDGVWRMLFGGNTGLGHTVGAGKTFTAIAGLMEMRRLGLKKKPCVVVPNHLTQQWAMDVLALYPAAKILVPRDEDYDEKKRRELTARIATGDWDLVIMPQSKFKLIGVSKENKTQFMNWQIDQIQQAMSDLEGEGGAANKITVKRLEKQIQKIEEKLKAILEKAEDPGTTFEETGIDYLAVDEAHMYKNLFYTSKLQNIRGLGNPEGSQMAADLFMKINFLRGLAGNNGVTSFLSGTPISNSITEVYAMMRYLSPEILDHYGISTFDGWVGAFATPVSKIEREIAGSYKAKTRLKFQNVPELIRAFKAAWDIKMQKHIKLPRPEMVPGSPELLIIPQSKQQEEFAKVVRRRSDDIKARKGPPAKGDDNMLALGTDASLGTLDYRLIDEAADEDPLGKVAVATENIIKLYKESSKDKLTQVVFVDRQSPKTGKEKPVSTTGKVRSGFDVYAAIRDKLVKAGIPAREIAFIHDAATKAEKQTLFDKVNKGDIRVLIGTTEKMGAGTNIQQRLVAVHRLVPPWRPSDIEQGDGRLMRPGNMINSLGYKGTIKNYAIADSFDAWMFGTLAKKDRMIQQIMDGDPNIRTVDDVDEDQATIFKQWANDTVQDPDQKRMIELQDEILNLSAQQADHARLVSTSQRIADTFPNQINQMKSELAKIKAASAENLNPEEAKEMVVVRFANPEQQASYDNLSGDEANEFIKSMIDIKDAQASITISVGNFSAKKEADNTFFSVQHKGPAGKTVYAIEAMYREEGNVVSKLLYRFSSKGIAKALRDMEEKVAANEARLKTAEKDAAAVFTGQAELEKLNAEVAEIERRMQAKDAANDADIGEDSGDEDVGGEDDDTDARMTDERRGPAREESIVRAMVENWKKGKKNLPSIKFVADHTQLPGNQKAGTDGVYDAANDTVYLNLSRMTDETTIENVLDHEVMGHKATAEMMDQAGVRYAFRNLYQLAEKGTIKATNGKGMMEDLLSRGYRKKDGETEDQFRLRMGEEAFAFLAEKKALGDTSTWSGALKVWVNRIIAAFKSVARNFGFVNLAKWGDAEIMTMVADARKTIVDGAPKVTVPGNSRRGAVSMKDLAANKAEPSSMAWSTPQQAFSSAKTSIPYNDMDKVAPVIFRAFGDGKISLGPINADIGGGRFDQITDWLRNKGVTNIVWDRFNRSEEHNSAAQAALAGGQADTATISNVLNVIENKQSRAATIATAFDSVKPGGKVFISVYAAPKAGEVKGRDSFQTAMKTLEYVDEIKAIFGDDVTVKGNIITAVKQKTTPTNDGPMSRFAEILGGIAKPEPGSGRRGAMNLSSLRKPSAAPAKIQKAGAQTTPPGKPVQPSPTASVVDRARYYLQDGLLPLKRMQEELAPEGLPEDADPYLKSDVYPGVVEEMALQFEDTFWKPFLKTIDDLGVDFADLEDYLYARHVPERNDYIQSINPKFAKDAAEGDDQGSGHTTEWAENVIDELDKEGKLESLKLAAEQFDKVNAFRRKLLISSGLQAPEVIAAWDKNYKHYVTLKGISEEARVALGMPEEGGATGTGQGLSVRKQERRATGRKTPASDLIANTKQMVDATIVRAGKQTVLKAFGEMIRTKAKDDKRFKWISGTDGKGEKAILPKKPVMGKDGEVVMMPDRDAKKADNAIWWVEEGQDQVVLVPRELADSMKKLDVPEMGFVTRILAGMNRWLGIANTALNVDFIFVNLIRDLQTAFISISAENSSKMAKEVVANVWPAVKNLSQIAMGKESDWTDLYNQFKMAGGKTGYFNALPTQQQMAKIESDLEELRNASKTFAEAPWYAVKSNIMKLASALSAASEVLETATRLATFKAGLDSGMSSLKAASLAKNVTVNFQRKGAWGVLLNSAFLFYNASVQGSAKVATLVKLAYDNPAGTAGKLIGGMILLGALLDQYSAYMSGKDDDDEELYWDKLDSQTKQNNLVIYLPDHKKGDRPYLLPLPYGFNTFIGIGRNLSAVMRGQSAMKAASDVAETAVNSFNPLGGMGLGFDMLWPTVAKPIMQHWYANKDYLGRDLVPPEPQFGVRKAESERYYRSVSPTLTRAAKALHAITGGDPYGSSEKNMPEFLKDWTDISPEVLQHYVDWFGGGAGKTMRRIVDMVYAAQKGELSLIDIGQIPIARRFVAPSDERYVQNDYRDNMDAINVAKDKSKAMMKEAMDAPSASPAKKKILDAIARLEPLAEMTKTTDDVGTARREAFRKIETLREVGGVDNAKNAEDLKNSVVKMQKVFNAGVNAVESTGKPLDRERRRKLRDAIDALNRKTASAGK